MGVNIFDLVPKRIIELEALKNKTIAIDAHLVMYQFLSTIRQADGTPLKDSHGNITSHLQGLFSRNLNLMQKQIKLCYVFDGKPPELKLKEIERRRSIKHQAEIKYKEAAKKRDIEEMKKYAQRTSRLTEDMIEEAKELLDALGIPIIQAPSEGEAQASYVVKKGDAYAVGTQDADALMFGAAKIVKNLTISERKKMPGKLSYMKILPELITLSDTLEANKLTQDQLIALCILVGTDYNPGGIKGIGPQKALKLVHEHKNDFEKLFSSAKWGDYFDFSWGDVFTIIKEMPVTDKYDLKFKKLDENKVTKLLCDGHDFSLQRISDSLKKLNTEEKQQAGLDKWFSQ